MKKYLFAAALMMGLTASAQTFNVHKTDGERTSYSLSEIKNVSMDEDFVTINKTDDTKKNFRVTDVDKMGIAEPSTDLGEGANCYIVLKEGDYEFSPLHVDGTAIEGVTFVNWLWASKQTADDTEQVLVSDVRYEDGKVKFHANGYYGNAVLAGMNANSDIVWTWHIWMPKDDPTVTPVHNKIAGTDAYFMDRALGAVSAKPEDFTDTWGLVYQWGRMTPIYGAHSGLQSETVAFSEAKKWTVRNSDMGYDWGLANYLVTPQEAIANPMTLYVNTGSDHNTWMKEDAALWRPDLKSNYDPCPAGFRISNKEELHYLHLYFVENDSWGATYSYTDIDQKTYTSYWPFMGYNRNYEDGRFDHNQHMGFWCNELDEWTGSEYLYPHVWGCNNRLGFIQALNGVGSTSAAMYIRPVVMGTN